MNSQLSQILLRKARILTLHRDNNPWMVLTTVKTLTVIISESYSSIIVTRTCMWRVRMDGRLDLFTFRFNNHDYSCLRSGYVWAVVHA